MKTNASFIYLKATKHVVSAFTRNGALDEQIDEEKLLELLAKDLRVRNVRKTELDFRNEAVNVQFQLKASDLSVLTKVIDDPIKEGAFTRPLEFQVNDNVLKTVARSNEQGKQLFESIEYKVESDGISVTLKPPGGKSLGEKPIQISALLRLGPDGIFDSRVGEVAGKTVINESNTGKVLFSSIAAGPDHQLLLMIEGIHPISDQLKLDTSRKWDGT